jgi:hypothetical protein
VGGCIIVSVPPTDTTVLWRLYNERREHSRAVILPGGPPHTLAFFVDNMLDRAENYDTMDLALFRAEDVKRTLIEEGWQEDA